MIPKKYKGKDRNPNKLVVINSDPLYSWRFDVFIRCIFGLFLHDWKNTSNFKQYIKWPPWKSAFLGGGYFMYFFIFGVFFFLRTLFNKNNWPWHGVKKSKRLSSVSRRAIITRIGSVERGYYKACTGVICKKSCVLVHFL